MPEWHLITGEYPPEPGGVADYTRLVASGLAAAGDVVHVWCPRSNGPHEEDSGVVVHRELGSMAPTDLRAAGRLLNGYPRPRRLLVQWVPHAFGFHSANLPLALWIWSRAFLRGDRIDVMIHEPYLPLPQASVRHTALALVHRIMLTAVLAASRRAWLAIQKWEERCRPYTFGRRLPFSWLPVPSTVSVYKDDAGTKSLRTRYSGGSGFLIGHFGTCGGAIGHALRAVIPDLLDHHPDRRILLIGHDSKDFQGQLLAQYPRLSDRIHATGGLSAKEVSMHISACDVIVQPYPDGVSTRRSSLMAALAHGKPIVTSAGSLTEPVWYGGSGVVLVPAGDDSGMVSSVNRLLADEGEQKRLSAAAAGIYERYFALANTIRALRNGGTQDYCIPVPHFRRA
jgi:hypothetical protein